MSHSRSSESSELSLESDSSTCATRCELVQLLWGAQLKFPVCPLSVLLPLASARSLTSSHTRRHRLLSLPVRSVSAHFFDGPCTHFLVIIVACKKASSLSFSASTHSTIETFLGFVVLRNVLDPCHGTLSYPLVVRGSVMKLVMMIVMMIDVIDDDEKSRLTSREHYFCTFFTFCMPTSA